MKRGIETKKQSDVSGIIAVILLITAIIVSVTGTWIVMDTISNAPMTTAMSTAEITWPDATTGGNIALNIEENPQENQIN